MDRIGCLLFSDASLMGSKLIVIFENDWPSAKVGAGHFATDAGELIEVLRGFIGSGRLGCGVHAAISKL